MADQPKDEPIQANDEELELERQQEQEEEDKNSDVDTSIPTEDDESDEVEESKTQEDTKSSEEEPEAKEQAPDGAEEDAEPRQTRKERRAERAKRFSELRRESQERDLQRQQLLNRPKYDPLDYSKVGDEVDLAQLDQDRQQYGDSRLNEGMQLERFYAEQERFNDKLEADNDYVLSKPEYSFMDENSETFDADLADGINDLFLSISGYDDRTKTFQNTGIRYKQFVPMMKSMMDKYAATRNANSERNISKQRGSAGVRPSAGSSRGSRSFTPEQIAQMTPAQYARYEKDIERQIQSLI